MNGKLSMQNPRLVLSALIKLLVFSGLLLFVIVLVNSLFIKDAVVEQNVENEEVLASIELADMFKGQIRKTRWNNKEVAVLLRQFPDKLKAAKIDEAKTKQQNASAVHPNIDAQTRSLTEMYFVYFNSGDSNNCPLYYSGGVFKDVCSLNQFDESGKEITANSQQFQLKIPPHHFVDSNGDNMNDTLIIGRWLSVPKALKP